MECQFRNLWGLDKQSLSRQVRSRRRLRGHLGLSGSAGRERRRAHKAAPGGAGRGGAGLGWGRGGTSSETRARRKPSDVVAAGATERGGAAARPWAAPGSAGR